MEGGSLAAVALDEGGVELDAAVGVDEGGGVVLEGSVGG